MRGDYGPPRAAARSTYKAPRTTEDGPRPTQEPPKTTPKSAQDGFRDPGAPRRLKTSIFLKNASFQRCRGKPSLAAQERPKGQPKRNQERARGGPREGHAKSSPRDAQGTPGEAKSDPGARSPKGRQGAKNGTPTLRPSEATREAYERLRRGPGAQRGPGQRGTDKRKQEQTRQEEKG